VSLEVTPKTKLMRVGETFEFQAIARDENGCRAAVETKWELVAGDFGSLSPSGTLSIPKDASTGTLTLRASVEDKAVSVAARVVSEEEFEALIAGGEYGVMGESLEAASINLSTSHVEFDAQSPGEEEGQKTWLLLFVVALLGLLVGAVVILLRKKTAQRIAPPHTEAPVEALLGAEPAAPEPAPAPPAEAPKPARLCPVCGKRFEDETMFCGEDGARLVRAN
jgi:hypothetical protein